jgi:hypothetical protein
MLGSYQLTKLFSAGDATYQTITDDLFTITKENAVIDYTGPEFIFSAYPLRFKLLASIVLTRDTLSTRYFPWNIRARYKVNLVRYLIFQDGLPV